jgi:vancomycin aglycone glucosyltransferase
MRVLLSTSGLRGDVEPVVALAVRLRAFGVEVRVCAPPGFEERFAGVGVPMVPVGQSQRAMLDGMRAMRQRTTWPSPEEVSRRDAEEIATQFDEVQPAVEGCDAVVASGVPRAVFAVRSMAEKLGIPYFYAAYCPIYLPLPDGPPLVERGDGWPPPGVTDPQVVRDLRDQGYTKRFGGPVDSQRAAIGLPPVENLFDYCFTDRPWLAADPVLAPLRPDHDAVQTGAWILPDERPLSSALQAFLDAGSPPVYVGFGSTFDTGDAARTAIEAIRATGRRVVFSRGWADAPLPDEGAECFAVGEVNVQALFDRVAAVVHHGGGGTTTVAARAGVPQVVLPQITEQPYFAERVAQLGIGVGFEEPGPTPTFDSLSAALATALAPETLARAAAVAGSVRSDGATVAAELVLAAANRDIPAVSM